MTLSQTPVVSIRPATAADGPTLVRLAALDSKPVPFGPVLIAEVDGKALAAKALQGDVVVADPFARTAELVQLLDVHATAVAETATERSATRSAGFVRRLGLAA